MLKRILFYLNPLTLFKKNESDSLNVKAMHIINRLSIYLFVMCIVLVLRKYI
jgi:cob(I)alamin adenosyltransferase